MPLEHCFTCPLVNGVHARPASVLEELARGFAAEVTLTNQRTGRAANAKSVLSLVGADVRLNDECRVSVVGPDERDAMNALTAFLRDKFPRCDDDLPPTIPAKGCLKLSPVIRDSGATFRCGVVAVQGVAAGRFVRAGGFRIPPELAMEGVADRKVEQRKIVDALDRVIASYEERLACNGKGVQGELLRAHRSMARDAEFQRVLLEAVADRGRTVAGAVADAEAHFTAMLSSSGSALLRERTLDIQDICLQVLRQVYGDSAGAANVQLTTESIVVAESLTPSQFLALNRRFLKGLVLEQAGTTSHTVILARSYCIPTLTGVANLSRSVDLGDVVLDGDMGVLVSDLTTPARRYYTMEKRRLAKRSAIIGQFAMQVAATRDNHLLECAANIATAEQAGEAFASGAEAIGLFRTEMLFLDRQSAPSEAEQYAVYKAVLEAASNRPVIIRTLDVGGDKPLPYLELPKEENPFLGYRALRIYPEFEALVRTQVRALVRASAHGHLKVMVPMVASVDECRWFKRIVTEEQARCKSDGVAFNPTMPVGAMVEVPSSAFAMDDLSRELDFFSVGTNDLLQYFMAVDRANPKVAGLYDPLQPAFLRLLRQIVEGAHRNGKWIGVCGEMAGQKRFLPLLTGLGFDEISVVTPAIAAIKADLAKLTFPDCVELVTKVLKCATASEVGRLLDSFSARYEVPLFDVNLIIGNADAITKEEAIKEAVDHLYATGRTDKPAAVEDAVWKREATYSTGFGHGFAIPHCKTGAVQSNSLVLLKLNTPVLWGSLDGKPVRVVVLLAIREGDGANEHMRIFAKLARQVMHEEFRARLEQEDDPAALCAFLKEKLDC